VEEIELPVGDSNRIHSWHLFPIRLRLARLTIDRNKFIEELAQSGVGSSVHWRPLHLHPYYQESFGWLPEDCPVATETWSRLVSLPLFPGMREEEIEHVIHTVKLLCARYARLKTISK
jgi:perosamine synthetase